jgi:hypothetical protein
VRILKRLLLFGATAVALLAGLAGFSAYSAQWVNVTAHVEKEIEMACVLPSPVADNTPPYLSQDGLFVDPDGCNFGVVFPQGHREKVVEVTLSRSFLRQDEVSSVKFDVLWECKLIDEELKWGDPIEYGDDGEGDPYYTKNICRNDMDLPDADNDPKGLYLDDNIRDHVTLTANSGCLVDSGPNLGAGIPIPGDAELEYLGTATVDNVALQKCFYHLAFDVPSCEHHVNPNTDPKTGPDGTPWPTIPCRFTFQGEGNPDGTEDDPQDWEHFADLGDTFKVQVWALVGD